MPTKPAADTQQATQPASTPAPAARVITAPHVFRGMNEVAGKLADVGIAKASRNEQQKFNFRGIDDMYNVIGPMLADAMVMIVPRVIDRIVTEKESNQGKTLFYVALTVEYDFISAVDGSMHTARTFGEAMDSGDKATNKAMSAAFKYLCMQAFCIPTEGDNDADATTHEVRAPARAAATASRISVENYKRLLNGARSEADLMDLFRNAYRAYGGDETAQAELKATYDDRKVALAAEEAEGRQYAAEATAEGAANEAAAAAGRED